MKSKTWMRIAVVYPLTLLAFAFGMSAQTPSQKQPRHRQYRLVDIGTLGGPTSQVNGGPPAMLNNGGVVVG
jgi:hypothetical protein